MTDSDAIPTLEPKLASRETFRTRPWYRWLVYGVAMLSFNLGVMLSDIGVAVPDIMRDLSIEADDIGLLIGTYAGIYALMQIPGGILADQVGPRRIMTLFLLIGGVGIIFFSLAPNLHIGLVGRVITALGVSVLYVNQIKVLRGWFNSDEFATAMGIGSAINAAGGLALRPLLAVVVEYVGWRTAYGSLGVLVLLFAILCWMIIRDRNPQWEHLQATENSLPTIGILQSIKIVFTNRQFLLMFAIATLAFGALKGVMWGWGLPLLMQGFSLSRVNASLMFMLLSLFGLVGAPLFGRMSDKKLKARKPGLIIGLIGSTMAILPFVFWAPQLKLVHLFAILPVMGLMGGGGLLLYTMVNELVPSSIAGVASAGLNMGPYLGRMLFLPLTGLILGSPASYTADGIPFYTLYDYQKIFVPSLMAGIVALLLLGWVKETMNPVIDSELIVEGISA